ncbi:MAG: oligosaccharide flippase family protein [Chloroflexota bacterium]|nr:oligosaccharide flippase family protein [Chloroflexota bacterium]
MSRLREPGYPTQVRPRRIALPGASVLARLGTESVGLVDQALVSGANFATMLLLARSVDPTEFGQFTLVYSGLLLAGVLQAALVTQPHNVLGAALAGPAYVRYTSSTAAQQLVFTASAAGLVLVGGLVGVALGSGFSVLLFALVPAIIAWELQEFIRRILYTEGRVRAVLLNDIISYGGQALLVIVLFASGRLDATMALYMIAATSAAALAFGILQVRDRLRPVVDLSAIRGNLAFGKWLAGAESGYWASTQIYLYLAAAVLGAAGAGLIRAAQLVFGPLNILVFYLGSVLPSRFARAYAEGGHEALNAAMRRTGLVVLPVATLYCALFVLFAGPALRLIYGDAYADGGSVLVLFALFYAVVTPLPILTSALRTLRRPRVIFEAYLIASLAAVGAGWLIVRAFGAEGAAGGMVFSICIVALYCAIAYEKVAVRETETDRRWVSPIGAAEGLSEPARIAGAVAADRRLLTWSCLLPRAVRISSEGAPTWFRELCQELSTGAGTNITVVWGKSLPPPDALDDVAGLVLVNSGVSSGRLRALGFHHVREMAVVPGVNNPRWFIPLDSRTVASAAFRIYTPYRLSARLQHFAARAVARTGSYWSRDRVTIAQRTAGAFESAVHEVLDLPKAAIGFASGSPVPPHKPVFVVLDARGTPRAFGKVAVEEGARVPLRREARVLAALAGKVPALSPPLLLEREVDGRLVTVQGALPGAAGPRSFSDLHRRFLDELHNGKERVVAETEYLGRLSRRLTSIGQLAPEVAALRRLGPSLSNLRVRSTIIHGDFAPWNIRQVDDRISAFDWEHGCLDGIPVIDSLHHFLQVGVLLDGWNTDQAFDRLMSFASEPGPQLDRRALLTLESVYLLDLTARALEDGPTADTAGFLALYRTLFARVDAALRTETTDRRS